MKAPGKSHRQGLTLLQLMDLFPSEDSAREWFETARWPDGRRCPHCQSERPKVVKSGKPMPYHCTDCREYFSVKTGTVMQSSKLPLRKWVIGIYLMSTSLKGVSSMKSHRDLGVTQKTAWMMAQKIREGWLGGSSGPLPSGTLEKADSVKRGRGRPATNIPERIPATAEEIRARFFAMRTTGHRNRTMSLKAPNV